MEVGHSKAVGARARPGRLWQNSCAPKPMGLHFIVIYWKGILATSLQKEVLQINLKISLTSHQNQMSQAYMRQSK